MSLISIYLNKGFNMSKLGNWFTGFKGKIVKAVTGKVVEKRVGDYIENLDSDGVVALVEIGAELLTTRYVAFADVMVNSLKDNKDVIAKLAGDNADILIQVQGIMKNISQISTDVQTPDNMLLLNRIKEAFIVNLDNKDEELTPKETNLQKGAESILNSVLVSMGLPKIEDKYYIYVLDTDGNWIGDFEQVDSARFHARCLRNKQDTGSFYTMKTRKKTYESNKENFESGKSYKTRTTKEFYEDLGMSEKAVDTVFPDTQKK